MRVSNRLPPNSFRDINASRPSARGTIPNGSALRMSSPTDIIDEEDRRMNEFGNAQDEEESKYERRRQEVIRMTPGSQFSNVQAQSLQS